MSQSDQISNLLKDPRLQTILTAKKNKHKSKNPQSDKAYSQGMEILQHNYLSLLAMAQLAVQYATNREALRLLSELFGRDARAMVRASELFPHYFSSTEEASHTEATPLQILSLLAIGKLPDKKAMIVFQYMQDYTLDYWQVKLLVSFFRERTKRGKSINIPAAMVRRQGKKDLTVHPMYLKEKELPKVATGQYKVFLKPLSDSNDDGEKE